MFSLWSIWIVSAGLLALILARGAVNGALPKHRVFFGYVAFVLASTALHAVLVATFGGNSIEYYYAYQFSSYSMPFLQIWILWDVYRRIVGYANTSVGYAKNAWRTPVRLAMIVGVLTTPVAWGVFSAEGGIFYSYHSLTLFIQMSLCLLVCREAVRAREEVDLGQNLKGILLGMSMLVGCQALNFVGLVFAQASTEVFWFLVQFIYFVALIIFTYTLWDEAPAFRPDLAHNRRLQQANRELYETLKSVLLNRR